MLKVMILAAGEGTRLRPLTLATPKPMVPLAHVPLLERTVRLLRDQGVSAIAVNLYHRAEVIQAHFGDSLTYSTEPRLLGTAGGVKRLESFFETTFIVLYGDNLYDFALAPLLAFHREKRALATLATFTAPNPSACGLVGTDALGRVTRFQEKPPADAVFTDQANAGVYVLEPEVLRLIPPGVPYDFGRELFPLLLQQAPGRLFALPLGGYLRDTGTPESYRQASWDRLAAGECGVHPTAQLGRGVRLTGRNIIGKGCLIGEGCQLHESILWDGCTLGPGVQLTGCILGYGVTVPAGTVRGEGALLA